MIDNLSIFLTNIAELSPRILQTKEAVVKDEEKNGAKNHTDHEDCETCLELKPRLHFLAGVRLAVKLPFIADGGFAQRAVYKLFAPFELWIKPLSNPIASF